MILLSSPIRMCIDITNQCNLRCVHCHAMANEDRGGSSLSTHEIMELIDQCSDNGVFVLQLSGGEPTLNPSFEAILGYALKKMSPVT